MKPVSHVIILIHGIRDFAHWRDRVRAALETQFTVEATIYGWFDLLRFCGSVLKYTFPFEQISDRCSPPILNEVGAKDPWPAIAESVTWGYGSAGTYGFLRPGVRDRWHAGAKHSYFLSRQFCDKYWIPFLKDGVIVYPNVTPEEPALLVRILSRRQFKYMFIFIAIFLISIVSYSARMHEALAALFGSILLLRSSYR
jgi:hypothetical protein